MRLSKALVAVALVVLVFDVHSSTQTVAPGPFVVGEVLVKFSPGATASAKADAHAQAGGTVQNEIASTGVQLVSVAGGDELAAIARYQRNPNILYAEPNFIRSLPEPISHSGSDVVPGDHYFDEQWALHNTGQLFNCFPWPFGGEVCGYIGTPDADIDAPEAWAISTGDPNVTVAVIDSGIDYNHPDLVASYVGGDDFVFNDGDPMDDHGHGTHVAATIAAAMNNPTGNPSEDEGVVGVAPSVKILAYKVCESDGSCTDFAIEQAIARAIPDGAQVINMSLGGTDFSQSTCDAVQAASDAGLVVIAGAGNNGSSTISFWPAACEGVISVAAFDEDHRRASFSNYGSWVDISAPGNVIMSAFPLAACGGATTAPGDTGCYGWRSGTSMATPHVAGAAALVWSRSDVLALTPEARRGQVVDILLGSADPIGVDTVRLDSWTTHGGLNLHDALSYGVTNLPPIADAGADQTLTDNNDNGAELVTLNGSASSDPDGSIISYEWSESGAIFASGATPDVSLDVGTHTVTLTVTDNDGDTDTDDVVVTVDAVGGGPNTPLDNFATSDFSTARGTVSTGTYVDTWIQDDFDEILTEEQQGGNPARSRNLLEHTWTFDVAVGAHYVFEVTAYHDSIEENFVFSYSRDNSVFTPMVVVTNTANNDWKEVYLFLEDVSGTVYVRVEDTDHTRGNGQLDSLLVDSMVITTTMGGGNATAPVVTIDAPSDGAIFTVGSSVSFSASANDAEDGVLDAALGWVSSIDGTIGSGAAFSTSALSLGEHTVTASVTDSGGLPGADSITITVDGGGGAGTLSVASIAYTGSGGPSSNKHLRITVAVIDGTGSPVGGAAISINLLRDTGTGPLLYAIGTATTSSSGQVSFQANNIPTGLYSTVVTNVVLSGYDWNAVQPTDPTYEKVD